MHKTLTLSIICLSVAVKIEKCLKNNDQFLKNTDETRDYLTTEINQNESMNKKHKKICMALNYIENLLNLVSLVTGCFSISVFASLV